MFVAATMNTANAILLERYVRLARLCGSSLPWRAGAYAHDDASEFPVDRSGGRFFPGIRDHTGRWPCFNFIGEGCATRWMSQRSETEGNRRAASVEVQNFRSHLKHQGRGRHFGAYE